MEVISSDEISIDAEADITRARRAVRAVAARTGLDTFAIAAITTATSELSRNVLTHGGGGSARIEELRAGDRGGVRVAFIDQGPGISDIDAALAGGFSTRRSLGLGLSGSRRLVDEFELDSQRGRGTRVVVVKWSRRR